MAKDKSKAVSPRTQETLSVLLKSLSIETWDVLLVGDGSGSGWQQPCGWGCISVERLGDDGEMYRRPWYGAVNNGTVNTAEGLAYFQPLNWLHAKEIERCKRTGTRRRAHYVHIITDSQYCQRMGSNSNPGQCKNGMIWAAYAALRRSGFLLHWHWVKRNNIALHNYVDLLSKLARGLFKKNRLSSRMLHESGCNIYDCNP